MNKIVHCTIKVIKFVFEKEESFIHLNAPISYSALCYCLRPISIKHYLFANPA